KEIILLDVLSVVALLICQAEHPLLEDGVLFIPERDGQANVLPVVTEAAQTVLVPAVGAAAGVVVGEVVPGVPVGAVVLAHGPPRALAQVGAPALPVCFPCFLFHQAVSLRVESHKVYFPQYDSSVSTTLPRKT